MGSKYWKNEEYKEETELSRRVEEWIYKQMRSDHSEVSFLFCNKWIYFYKLISENYFSWTLWIHNAPLLTSKHFVNFSNSCLFKCIFKFFKHCFVRLFLVLDIFLLLILTLFHHASENYSCNFCFWNFVDISFAALYSVKV